MSQVRKGGKSGRQAISRVEKGNTKLYVNRTDLSSITEATTQAYAARNKSKLAPFCLLI